MNTSVNLCVKNSDHFTRRKTSSDSDSDEPRLTNMAIHTALVEDARRGKV
jgi:hypothetical protein